MKVAVSLLRSNPEEMTAEWLGERMPYLEQAGADRIHWDLMDGRYNPNETTCYFTRDVMREIMSYTKLDSDAHLMVADPLSFLENIEGCANQFTFHREACPDHEYIIRTIERIKSLRSRAGISIEPETPVEEIEEYTPFLDAVLIMTVKTGYSGQEFMDMKGKIKKLLDLRRRRGLKFEIEVDGGINDKTIGLVSGADVVISASYIMNSDYADAVGKLKGVKL